MKILIAEDDYISQQLLQRTLDKWGHEIIPARNGQEAWDILRKENIKLVIADWMMPVMDGLELCRKIRSMKEAGYVYVIFLTGKDRTEDAINGLDAGADDYITKPFEWDELRARIRSGERIINLIDKVKTLSGLLPICASCKKVRDDKGYWRQIESYISEHSETEFTHGICPECGVKLYPDYYNKKKKPAD
ncbi:MAG: response regulator [Nitrospirae bacterium]|nr:response regulator [Nitrospirota bacterium]